jgi:hypothetical protein
MSNALNVAATAIDVIEALLEAKNANLTARNASAQGKEAANNHTLTAYARAAVAIRTLMDQGLWTTGKQKRGVVSASAALKDALTTEAKAKGVSAATAKRVIEKAAALLDAKSKAHVEPVFSAAATGEGDVVKAMVNAGFTKEADIIKHVEPAPENNVVLRIVKAITKLEKADRTKFVYELVNHEIIDDILAEANKSTAEERAAARKEASSKSNAAAAAAERRKAKAPKARAKKEKKEAEPVAEEHVADPFAA